MPSLPKRKAKKTKKKMKLSKFVLSTNAFVLGYIWVDNGHYEITSHFWSEGETIPFLSLFTFFLALGFCLHQDEKEEWIPIHGILRIWLRSFSFSFSTPLTFLLVKLTAGFSEMAEHVKGHGEKQE